MKACLHLQQLFCSRENQLASRYKSENLPSHDFNIDQVVMYQDSTSKCWFLATVTRLSKEPRSYIITTKDGVQYRKTQAHLKPYEPQDKKSEDKQLLQNNHMWTVKSLKSQKIDNVAQSRPKRYINPQIKLDL